MDAYFSGFLALGGGFIAGGVTLYWSKFGRERKNDINYIDALLIGTAQGLAIIPSLSRSGMTIAVALLLGIKREKAFKFSFLLSIPAIVGALGLTFYEQRDLLTLAGIGLAEILVGIAVTIALSFLALTLLRRTLAKRKFHLFAFYCLILGALLIALSLS
jgi:undecaprenyl-diphosphatase